MNNKTVEKKKALAGVSEKRSSWNHSAGRFIVKYNALLMLLLLVFISSLISPVFLTRQNVFNVVRQITPLALISLGMLMVILTGNIDLSVGSLQALGGVMIAMLIGKMHYNTAFGGFLALLISILVCAALGCLTGLLVSQFQVASFIASLAMMTIVRGIAYIISLGQPIRMRGGTTAERNLIAFGENWDPLLRIPLPVWLAIVIVVIFILISKFTAFGRLVVATGSNSTAVELAGINVKFYQFIVYTICGVLSGVAGVVVTARSAVGAPVIGAGMELDAIAACVIGGASLRGGKGTVGNMVIGVLILGLIGNIMNLLSVPAYPQQVVKGVIIIAAVLLQGVRVRV
jgi:ribose transport system permease protein